MLFLGLGPQILYLLVALFVALTIHEASHSLVAYWLGDPTSKNMGRLSLNPFAHMDPFGTMMILLVGLGWGKPVQINPDKLKPGPRIGMALVAIAGPISNLLLAAIVSIPLRFHWVSLLPQRIWGSELLPFDLPLFSFGMLLAYIIFISLGLAVFNLIPINPLDGSRLWQIILPIRWYMRIAQIELLGLALVIGLVLSDRFLGTNMLMSILGPPINWLWRQFVGMSPVIPI
jgi:Zn-dependent protease